MCDKTLIDYLEGKKGYLPHYGANRKLTQTLFEVKNNRAVLSFFLTPEAALKFCEKNGLTAPSRLLYFELTANPKEVINVAKTDKKNMRKTKKTPTKKAVKTATKKAVKKTAKKTATKKAVKKTAKKTATKKAVKKTAKKTATKKAVKKTAKRR
jgi:hypothetical protein